MRTFRTLTLLSGLFIGLLAEPPARAATLILSDNYNVTGSGSGFGLNAGLNSGINPPTTRLTGSAASGLRYMNTGTKATTAYTITSSKARITALANPGRFTLSANGTTPFDFSSALGSGAATPANPVVYDLSISIDNDSASTYRTSFAFGTTEGDATTWDFGFQVYRAASGNNFYTIGKRIDTVASGLGSDLNATILTMGANTYGTEITILMRVTDAGSESSSFNSRVQLSLNGGSSWFYDTDTDANLTSGFRFNGAGRYVMWDVAPSAGNVTYDNFSMNWISGPRTWTGGGANGNWNTSANWGGAVPSSGDKLIFNGTTRQTNTNDLSGLTLPWVKFNNGGFALYGNAFTVSGAITNSTGNNTLNNALTLSGAVRMQSDSGTLTLAGTLGGTGSLTKDGSGTVQLAGTGANTFSGNTVVNSGTLALGKTVGVNAIAGNVTVGDGSGADTLQLTAANQIADSSVVTVSANGVFSLNGLAETVSGISSSSSASQVSLGSGTLTINGASTFAGVISGSGSLVKQGSGTLTLNGANTFSGNTTVSAGTLALGAGGSIANSPNITIVTGTTLDVSAASFSLGASQTLVRTSSTGAANINGSATLSSGAKVSLIANGTLASVGTFSVTGGLTLNANVITIDVGGAPLDVGTYPLISYTGAKSGSFNSTPTVTGLGLQSGLAGKIVETTGQISLKVHVPGHGIAAASIKVVEHDLANTTNSVTVTTTMSINGLQVRDGSSRGDYTVQVGASGTDDINAGVLITSVAENGKDHGEDSGINYCTSALSFNSGGYFIPTCQAPDGTEYNINVSAAYFPYNQYLGGYARNSAGTAGGPNNLLTSSSSLVLGTHFVDNGGGLSTVNLTSLGINSQTDGVLLVTGGGNNDEYAASKANTNGTWTIYLSDNGTNGGATTQGAVAFAYVPKANVSVISGKFQGDGSILMYNGSSPRFSVTNTAVGTWKLTIPGYSSSKGVLVISAEGGTSVNQDNIVSAQPSGDDWIIQSRDLPGLGLQLPADPVASFVFIPAPSITLVAPANNANVSSSPTLTVSVTNNNPGNLTVTFHGHRLPVAGPGEDFTIAVLPDTQNYARENSGSGNAVKEMWFAQTDWIVNNRASSNIAYVATLGDCVQNGNDLSEWKNATNAYYRLEKQSTTDLLDGIPYGVTVGNHDQQPAGDPEGSTSMYNQYFGISHWDEKDYYGGHYHTNNDNWINLFSAGGMDFLVISFEYGRYGTLVFDWAQSVIDAHPNRRIIVLTHHAGSDYHPSQHSNQGEAIYEALKVNPNFFLMMSGHVFSGSGSGEGHRTNTFNGNKVYTLVSDYQGRFNGGNGLMRLMTFSPANNSISIKTYSPWTLSYETDFNSQFTLPYNMQPNGAGVAGTAYAALKTNVNVLPGAQTSFVWSGLTASRPYQWYVTVTDEYGDYATSTEWTFNTTAGFAGLAAPGDANSNGLPDAYETANKIKDADADQDGDGQSNLSEYIANTNPNDAESLLQILDAKRQLDGTFGVTWSSVGGTRYRIQYSDSLTGEFRDIEREEAVERDASSFGAAATQTFSDAFAPTNSVRYYRIKVVPTEQPK